MKMAKHYLKLTLLGPPRFPEIIFSSKKKTQSPHRRNKAVRQGFDPELLMTELSCHQLGEKLKLFILTVRPKSTYEHQKIKFVDVEKGSD